MVWFQNLGLWLVYGYDNSILDMLPWQFGWICKKHIIRILENVIVNIIGLVFVGKTLPETMVLLLNMGVPVNCSINQSNDNLHLL